MSQSIPQPPADVKPAVPEVPPEQRRFIEVLNELLVSINDVVYTANYLDGNLVQGHPELHDLVESVRKLGKVAWEFQKIVRNMAGKAQQPRQ